jgi:transcriptional regulator with AAA-type ATPase domain
VKFLGRERSEDLPLLLNHFLEKASAALSKSKPTPPEELLTLRSSYHFPGNIREMESMVFDSVSSHRSGKLSMDISKSHIFQKPPALNKEPPQQVLREGVSVTFSERLPTLKELEWNLVEAWIGSSLPRLAQSFCELRRKWCTSPTLISDQNIDVVKLA